MRPHLAVHNWLILDLVGLSAAFILLASIPVDVASPLIYFSIILLFILMRRHEDMRRFAIASLIGIIWLYLAKDQYGYAGNFITVAGYNIFPLFMVPSALIGIWVLYKALHDILPTENFLAKWAMFTLIVNWPIVIFVEYAGYHWLNIQNEATAKYTGLAFCDCLHAPWWMQLTYFAFGPIFFLLCYLLDLHKHDDQK